MTTMRIFPQLCCSTHPRTMLWEMSNQTRFLARYIGLYELIVALSMFAHKADTAEAVAALLHDRPMLYLGGLITLALGLALVLAHNIWSAGALARIVTLIGWLTLIKGLMLVFLPSAAPVDLYLQQLRFEQFFYGYAAAALVLGAYLTAAGFRRASR